MSNRLLHLALTYLINEKILTKRQGDQIENHVRQILDEFCKIWMQYSQQKQIKEAEEDSMYKFKSKSHCMDSDEAEINEKQYKEMFPSFDGDFHDVIPKENLEDYSDESTVVSSDVEMDAEQSDQMSHVDLCAIYNAVEELYNDGIEIFNERIINSFIASHREALLLSTLGAVRCGMYWYSLFLRNPF